MSNEPDWWPIPGPSVSAPTPSYGSIKLGGTSNDDVPHSSSISSKVKVEIGTSTGGHSSSMSSAKCSESTNAPSYFNLSPLMFPTDSTFFVEEAWASVIAGQPTLTQVPKPTLCSPVPSALQNAVGASKFAPVPAQAFVTNVPMAQNKSAGPKLPAPALNIPGNSLIDRNDQGSNIRSAFNFGMTDNSNAFPMQPIQNREQRLSKRKADAPVKYTGASFPLSALSRDIPARTSLVNINNEELRLVPSPVPNAGGTSTTASPNASVRLVDPPKAPINETVDQSEIKHVRNQTQLTERLPSAPLSIVNVASDVNTGQATFLVGKRVIKKLPTRTSSSHNTSSSSTNYNLESKSNQENNVQKPTSLTERAPMLPDDTAPVSVDSSVPIADGRSRPHASLVVEAKRSSVVPACAPSAPSSLQAPPSTAPPPPVPTSTAMRGYTCAMMHPPPFVQYVPYEVHYLEMDQEDLGLVRRVRQLVGAEGKEKEESESLPANSGVEGRVNNDSPGSHRLQMPFVLNASKQNPIDYDEEAGAPGRGASSASAHCATCQCQSQAPAPAPSLSSTMSTETQTSNDSDTDTELSMARCLDDYHGQPPDPTKGSNCGKQPNLVPSWHLPSISTIARFILTWIAHFVLLVFAFLFVDEYRGNGTTRTIMRDRVVPSIGPVNTVLGCFNQDKSQQQLMLGAGSGMQ